MQLGHGTYGNVYEHGDEQVLKVWRDEITNEHQTVKIVGLHSTFIRELIISQKSNSCHPGKLHVNEGRAGIVYQKYHCDLQRMMDMKVVLNEQHLKSIVYRLIRIMADSHRRGVVHLDIKPMNILVDMKSEPYNVTICDWGLGSFDDIEHRRCVCSINCRPPELFVKGIRNYDRLAVDVWSMGIVILQLIEGRRRMQYENDENRVAVNLLKDFMSIVDTQMRSEHFTSPQPPIKAKINLDGECSENTLLDFLEKLLVFDPSARWTFDQLLEHPWLSDVYHRSPPRMMDGDHIIQRKISDESLNSKQRTIIFDWLFIVHMHAFPDFKIRKFLFHAYELFDRYVENVYVPTHRLQLSAIVIFRMMVMAYHPVQMTIEDCVYSCGIKDMNRGIRLAKEIEIDVIQNVIPLDCDTAYEQLDDDSLFGKVALLLDKIIGERMLWVEEFPRIIDRLIPNVTPGLVKYCPKILEMCMAEKDQK